MAFALTTKDNPFSPFTQFEDWLTFDLDNGYNTCGYLSRIARTSNQLSDKENEKEIVRAIDEIVRYDPLNIYMRVSDKDEFKLAGMA